MKGDFYAGTNGLNAFEACLECGACSEEKFLESDAYNSLKIGRIIGTVIGGLVALGVLIWVCWFCIGMGHFHSV